MSFYFPCRECGRQAFLFRGLCDRCWPEGHAAYNDARARWNDLFQQYGRETGEGPLAEWSAFEAWLEQAE